MNEVSIRLRVDGASASAAAVESVSSSLDRSAQAAARAGEAAMASGVEMERLREQMSLGVISARDYDAQLQRLANEQASTAASAKQQASEIEALRLRYDPAYASAKLFSAEQVQLKRALDAGLISQQRHGELLKIAEKNAQGAGSSLAQYQAALRGVPAQFTDIATSIAAGQNPLTVFLQQGGQLKDMFGGAGAAARALSGYVASLVTPFTVGAVVIGSIAIAAYQGSRELGAYSSALIMTGNAAGVTAGQLDGMATRIKDSGRATQGAAAEALVALVSQGGVAKEMLQETASASLAWGKATGQSVADIAKNFSDLAKDPLAASLKLNQSLNYLTDSTYSQIKALQEQGRHTEAATLAQKAYSDMMNERAPAMLKNLGLMERGWNAVASAIKGVWDGMMKLGRQDSTEVQLVNVRKQIDALEAYASKAGKPSQAQLASAIAGLRDQESVLQSTNREMLRGAAIKEDDAKKLQARLQWDDIVKKNLSDELKLKQEIIQVRNVGQALGLSEREIEDQVAAVREKSAKAVKKEHKYRQDALAGLVAELQQKKAYLETLKDQGSAAEKAFDSETRVVKIQEELKQKMSASKRAIKEKELAQAELIATTDRQIDAEKRHIEIEKDSLASNYKTVSAAYESADAVEKQLATQLRNNDAIGLTGVALAEHTNKLDLDRASMLERMATQAQAIGGQDSYVESLRREAAALRELANARVTGAQKQISTDATKKTQEDWDRAAKDIERSLTDALARGFESGKGFSQSMADYVSNALQTSLVRSIAGPVASAIAGIFAPSSAAAQAGGAAGNPFDFASLTSGLAGNMNKLNQGFSKLFDKMGVASGSTYANYLTNGVGMLGGAYLGQQISGNFSIGNSGSTVNALGAAIGSALGGPVGAVLGGALGGLANRAFGMGTKEAGQSYITSDYLSGVLGAQSSLFTTTTTATPWTQKGGWFQSDKSGTDYSTNSFQLGSAAAQAVQAEVDAARGAISAAETTLGGSLSNMTRAININLQGLDDAQRQAKLADAVRQYTQDLLSQSGLGFVAYYQQVGESVQAAVGRVSGMVQAVRKAFDLFGRDLQGLTGVAETQAALAAAFGGADAFASAADSFFSNFYRESEQAARKTDVLNKQFKSLGLDMPASREAFRQVAEAQDLATESGRQQYAAIMQLSAAFAELVPWTKDAAAIEAELAQQRAAIERERFGLEGQLLQLQGNTAAIRERELAALDPSNRALQAQIYALQDQQVAAQAAAQAEAALAQQRANIERERFGLEGQLLQLQGDSAALRERELDALDPSNKALQEQIYALQDQQAAAQASAQAAQEAQRQSEALRQAWSTLGDTMAEEVNRIRGLLTQSSGQGYAAFQSQFAVTTAQARSGDQAAAGQLAGISRALLDAAATSATNGVDLARIQASTAASLEETMRALSGRGVKLPSFDVGTNFVPNDMVALIHAGEAIVPRAYNPAAGAPAPAGEIQGQLQAIARALDALAADNSAENRATVALLAKMARILDDVSEGGTSLRTVAAV